MMSVPDMKNGTEVFTPGPEEGPDGQDALFLGPLMSDKVQKDDLIRFIQGKCQECLQHLDDPDQQKSYFFWMIMENFCNGNGRVMMVEIAVLLFKGYGCVRRKLGRVKNQEDWCLPLARLLCSTATGDEHRKAIIEMGDDLGSRGLIYASHICYVVAQMVLGSRRRFQVIGHDWVINHHSVTKEVMERTEIYEYVLSLTSGIGQPHFQEFKYLYACDLADAGLSAQALAYCESIARNIFTFPRLINSFLMERVIMLCDRLLQGMEEEKAEWLLKLFRLYRAFSAHSHFYVDVVESISCSYESQEFQEQLDSRYTVGELLGKGSLGTVYAGVRNADGLQVAMKYVLKRAEDSCRGEKPREVALMEMVSKPPRCVNVVELLEWIDVCTSFVLVLERPVPCMDLRKFCESKKDGRLSESLSRDIMLQVFRAAHHCFKRGVVHRDIRADNVLINTDTLEVKLIDFGCGEFLLENYFCTSYSGLSTYVWSLAVLLVELICGDICFFSLDYILEKCSKSVSEECCHLISWCLKNPHNRPTFEEILSHKWFTMELQDTAQERIRVVLLACGSFNPITNMHLRMFELARDHLENTRMYQVVKGIISPVGDAYKKKGLIEACHRVEMARLATENSSWISVDDWESQQAEWVETVKVIRHHHAELSSAEENHDKVDTVKFSKKRRLEENEESSSDHNRSETLQLKLLCGADMLLSFSIPNLWKNEDIVEIVGRFGIVCITRSGYDAEEFVYQSDVLHKHHKNIHIVREWVTNEILATHVRRAVCKGQSVRYLLPDPVVHYIQDQHLYSAESEQKNADVISSSEI